MADEGEVGPKAENVPAFNRPEVFRDGGAPVENLSPLARHPRHVLGWFRLLMQRKIDILQRWLLSRHRKDAHAGRRQLGDCLRNTLAFYLRQFNPVAINLDINQTRHGLERIQSEGQRLGRDFYLDGLPANQLRTTPRPGTARRSSSLQRICS